MRYESPLYLAEQAASLDLLSGGRVRLGIGRGSPEIADGGYRHFGNVPARGTGPGQMGRDNALRMLAALRGAGVAAPNPEQSISDDLLPIMPQSPTLHERILWGAGNRDTAMWAAEHGLGLTSSTVVIDDTAVSFTGLQRQQIDSFHDDWRQHGWSWQPRVTVARGIESRSVREVTGTEKNVEISGEALGVDSAVGHHLNIAGLAGVHLHPGEESGRVADAGD
ncbi:LLM class flavin-dependent oxidoreductase [Paramicrobacterium fandaimingii]|uniref:LLM class flavin-dependent oxidoreductase n=1 Tax=Paramicrobacterium fandaimingii TaxID=2708079 RepID=UPI00141DDA0F|nr:LLM class flavin-dependent oxidoreductase [Microbacterium fandaimingii]